MQGVEDIDGQGQLPSRAQHGHKGRHCSTPNDCCPASRRQATIKKLCFLTTPNRKKRLQEMDGD